MESTIWSMRGNGYGSLGASLVEVGEVNAQALLAVGLEYDDRVGDPVGMGHLTDELGLLGLFYFLDDVVLFFWCLTVNLLLHGAYTWARG